MWKTYFSENMRKHAYIWTIENHKSLEFIFSFFRLNYIIFFMTYFSTKSRSEIFDLTQGKFWYKAFNSEFCLFGSQWGYSRWSFDQTNRSPIDTDFNYAFICAEWQWFPLEADSGMSRWVFNWLTLYLFIWNIGRLAHG